MRTISKSLTVLLGFSALGFTSYIFYLLFKKDEDDLLDNNYVRTSKYKTVEMKIPKDVIRALIGRNGSNIKQIEAQTNTRINFKDREGTNDKICIIRGSIDTCNIAYNIIQDFISNQPVIDQEQIFVPPTSVRRIIGRGGQRISEIGCLSGAKLTIIESKIIIKGTREQINVARSLIEETVEQCQQNQQDLEESLAKREPRHPIKKAHHNNANVRKLESPKCERISPLPGQQDNQFEVYISAMSNPSKFWLQIVGPKATQLDCLVEEMTEYYNKPENRSQHLLDEINTGDLVAAIFRYDNKWYRAEVLEIAYEEGNNDGQKLARLYYVDYGDTDVIPCIELYELRTDMLRLHFQAIECFLARIEPIGNNWTEEAIDLFEELGHVAQWKKLSAKLNGYALKEKTRADRESSPVPGIDLYNVSNEQDIDVAEELVKNGHAVFKRGDIRSSSRTTSTSNLSVSSNS